MHFVSFLWIVVQVFSGASCCVENIWSPLKWWAEGKESLCRGKLHSLLKFMPQVLAVGKSNCSVCTSVK